MIIIMTVYVILLIFLSFQFDTRPHQQIRCFNKIALLLSSVIVQEIVSLSQINDTILFLHVFVRSLFLVVSGIKFDSQTKKKLLACFVRK